mmetsp:Transcript_9929/g.11023  ORF Transcript_9929/g.11023 Transcript_9929/m.11023 type:complete len:86 (-) Transcript_9929:270-527(-)
MARVKGHKKKSSKEAKRKNGKDKKQIALESPNTSTNGYNNDLLNFPQTGPGREGTSKNRKKGKSRSLHEMIDLIDLTDANNSTTT